MRSISNEKSEGLEVPEEYFSSLPDKVIGRIQEDKQPKVIQLFNRQWLAIAATLVFLFSAIYMIQTNINTENTIEEYSLDIEVDEALDYLLENENLYMSDLISLEYIPEEDLENQEDYDEYYEEDLEDFFNELEPEDLEDLL